MRKKNIIKTFLKDKNIIGFVIKNQLLKLNKPIRFKPNFCVEDVNTEIIKKIGSIPGSTECDKPVYLIFKEDDGTLTVHYGYLSEYDNNYKLICCADDLLDAFYDAYCFIDGVEYRYNYARYVYTLLGIMD